MSVPLRLLRTLDHLNQEEFKRFQWWLTNGVLDSFKTIPRSRLEDADRMETVDMMTRIYGKEMAVNVTVEILRNIGNNNAAAMLQNKYTAGGTAAGSTSSTAPTAAAAADIAAAVAAFFAPAAPPPAAPVAPPAAAAAPAAPPAPVTMTAQQEGVLISPTVTGCTVEAVNITMNNNTTSNTLMKHVKNNTCSYIFCFIIILICCHYCHR